MKKFINETTVTTSRGTEINVVSGLQLREIINLDGHVTEVDCCRQIFRVKINDKNHPASSLSTRGFPRMIKGNKVLATLGNCYLTDADVVGAIQEIITKTEMHPAWIAKVEKSKQSKKEQSEYDAHCDRMSRIMGE